jgi:hypothetical protein
MLKCSAIVCAWFALGFGVAAAQPAVRVDTSQLQGPRPLQEQTRIAAIRDYLQSWQSMSEALEHNRVDLLGSDFIGVAKDKVANAIDEQARLGVHTRYQDRAHDIQVIFYSPEGLSIELLDRVDYDVQVIDHNKQVTTVPTKACYIVVLTPSEVRWKVRVMQAVPGSTAN